MRPGEAFLFWLMLVPVPIAVPWLTFALASLFAGFPRLRLSQVLGIVGVMAWTFGLMRASDGPGYGVALLVVLTTTIVLLSFAGCGPASSAC